MKWTLGKSALLLSLRFPSSPMSSFPFCSALSLFSSFLFSSAFFTSRDLRFGFSRDLRFGFSRDLRFGFSRVLHIGFSLDLRFGLRLRQAMSFQRFLEVFRSSYQKFDCLYQNCVIILDASVNHQQNEHIFQSFSSFWLLFRAWATPLFLSAAFLEILRFSWEKFLRQPDLQGDCYGTFLAFVSQFHHHYE